MSEPKTIISGTKVIWSREFAGDEASASQFEYIFISEQFKQTIEASYATGEVIVSISSTDSAAIDAGHYNWFLVQTLHGEKYQIAQGRLEVKADPTATQTTTVLTHNEKMLTAIRKRLEGRILTDHENYSIDGRSLSRIPFEALKKFENDYAWKVHNEKVTRGEIVRRRSIRFR